MRFKFLGLIAILALVAGCETAPKETASASGAGNASHASNAVAAEAASKGTVGTQDQLLVDVGDTVHFDFDKYNLGQKARAVLDKQAAWLAKYPDTNVVIEGHCDERGTREYNLALGERRANSVRNYMIALGVDSSRLKVISYGKERPVAMGSNEEAWAQNRRSVTKVVAAGS